MVREIRATPTFDKLFKRLPQETQRQALEKLRLWLDEPSHPSLRIKRIRGTKNLWELSVSMQYRVTLEFMEDTMVLRRIGTHDVLKKP